MTKKTFSIKFAGLMTLLLAVLFTGCSITNPVDNFKLVVDAVVEENLIPTQEFTADPVNQTLFQNTQLGSGSPMPPSNKGDGLISESDEDASVSVQIGQGQVFGSTFSQTLFYVAIGMADYQISDLCKGTLVNNGQNDVTITYYLSASPNYDDGDLRDLAMFTVNAGQQKTINSDDDFDQLLVTASDAQWAFYVGLGLWGGGSRNFYLHVHGTGNPDLDVDIQQLNMSLPATVHFTQTVTSDEVADYSLEELRNVVLIGTATNNGNAAINSDFYLSNGDLNRESDRVADFSIRSGSTFNFNTDQYFFMDNNNNSVGQDTLMARFTSLFNGNDLTFNGFFTSNQSITIQVSNLGISADAQVGVE